jgi:hypothetical protein
MAPAAGAALLHAVSAEAPGSPPRRGPCAAGRRGGSRPG